MKGKAQLKKIQQLKPRPRKSNRKAAANTGRGTETPFQVMKRQWRDQKNLKRRDWERAPLADRTRFIVEVLKQPLDAA